MTGDVQDGNINIPVLSYILGGCGALILAVQTFLNKRDDKLELKWTQQLQAREKELKEQADKRENELVERFQNDLTILRQQVEQLTLRLNHYETVTKRALGNAYAAQMANLLSKDHEAKASTAGFLDAVITDLSA